MNIKISGEAEYALACSGLGPSQLLDFGAGKPVAFYLKNAAEGTITIAQFQEEGRLRAGIYLIKNVGGGLMDFLVFESAARAAARALGARELDILAFEVTNPRLRSVLEDGGFLPTTMEAPEELGNDTFNAISRVESVD